MANPGGLLIESLYSAYVSQNGGYYSALPIATTSTLTGGSGQINGNLNVTGAVTAAAVYGTSANGIINAPTFSHTPTAINTTATATAAQVATGYITSTSAAAVTITLPTATALATQLAAGQGSVFELYIDNTAGAHTITITPDASMVASQVAQVATYGVPTFGLMTVVSGTSGIGCFRFVFSSATACNYARVF